MIPKFRVWHKPMQRMGEVLAISFERQKVKIRHLRGTTHMTVPFDDVELMQSTWRFDKNGEEIFEGDVVDVFDSRYTVFYDSKNASFRLNPRDKRWNTDYMSNYEHEASFEIIGSIYENPELVDGME